MPEIILPPYYVDTDFSRATNCNGLMHDGQEFGRGYKPETPTQLGKSMPFFGERFKSLRVNLNELPEILGRLDTDNTVHVSYRHNQRNEGTCTANACAAGMQVIRNKSYGKEYAMSFAPSSAYRYCASSANSGSSVSCVYKRARDVGLIPIDSPDNQAMLTRMGLNPGHVLPPVGWNARMPAGAMEETAPHFRLEEVYAIRDLEDFVGALVHAYAVHYGRSGHSILALNPEVNFIHYLNSWGAWGETINDLQAYGKDTFEYLRRTGAINGAVAYRSVVHTAAMDKAMDSMAISP